MNKEEAITTLKNYIERITGGMFPGEREILVEAFDALRGPQPDPITGLVPCGCGGEAEVKKGVNHRSGYYVICEKCECNIGLDRDDYLRPYGAYPTEEQAVSDWNTAMGYTAPPRPGAIVLDAGEMAPNGDEGAEGA